MVLAGWDKQEIATDDEDGYAMFGYGMWHHRARGKQTPLHARAVCLRDDTGATIYFCCLDLGYISHAVRDGVVADLKARIAGFDEAQLVVTCTHTHSGPGGCSHEALFNVVTPGFNTKHFSAVVTAAVMAIENAARALAPTELELHEGRFDDRTEVAWNRAVHAYNLNPEVVKRAIGETHLAINRGMRVLGLRRDGTLHALISFFGVHGTALGSHLTRFDGDNKGYAARHAEAALLAGGASAPVAIFAQATAGDVSPHYHGPGQMARRNAIAGEAEYAYAKTNGERQGATALRIVATVGTPIDGAFDAIFGYADFNHIAAAPKYANGRSDATTSEPCQGVAFAEGTPVDGRGINSTLAGIARVAAGLLKIWRLGRLAKYAPDVRAYYERIYAAQGTKAIFLESGAKTILGQPLDRIVVPDLVDPAIAELKRQVRIGAIVDSPLVPSVLPLQIILLGPLALVCMPGEFTTTAGARLETLVRATLAARGITTAQICTYSNDYMGYVTTNEEYQAQSYEGGHTLYGQWTLAAFQTRVEALAAEMLRPAASRAHDQTTRPAAVPAKELALRTNIPAPGRPRA